MELQMEDEATVIGTDEVEAEAQEVDEIEQADEDTEDTVETESESDIEDEADEDEEIEEISFDFGGNEFRVPKGSIPEELAVKVDEFVKGVWSDYTRKSQGNAEDKKSLEAREAAVQKVESLSDEALDTFSRGRHLANEIQQLNRVDLTQMWQSDPDRARLISDAKAQKQAEFQNIQSTLNQQEHQLSEAQQAERARVAEEGKTLLDRRVKGFGAHEDAVIQYAIDRGIPEKAAKSDIYLNVPVAEAFYKAMMYDKIQAQAKKPQKPATAQPVKATKSKSGSVRRDLVKDADKMSSKEWLEARNAQLKRKSA